MITIPDCMCIAKNNAKLHGKLDHHHPAFADNGLRPYYEKVHSTSTS